MKDGHTKREHLRAAGVPVSQWGVPPLPGALAHVWHWYCDLSRGRGQEGVITWPAIEAYCRLMRLAPTPFELRALGDLDILWQTEGRA